MRKIMFVIFLIAVAGAFASCSSFKKQYSGSLKKTNYDSSQQSREVTLSVKEENITPETQSITLIFNNFTDDKYAFGEEPHLEMNDGEIWYVVPTLKTSAWDDVLWIIPPNENREYIFSIKNNYAELNSGRYRIVKELHSKDKKIFSIAEFEIY